MSASTALRILGWLLLIAAGGSLAPNGPLVASSRAAGPLPAERIAIRAEVNGLFVTVMPDGSLAPASPFIGTAEQFELHDLGRGVFALQSVANGKFVRAGDRQPLTANGDGISGAAETFRTVGGSRRGVRIRSVGAKQFVCAEQGGRGVLTTRRGCPRAWQLVEFEAAQSAPPAFTLTRPIPGSVLLAATATFAWDRSADDSWVKIGSVPGGSDIHASSALGAATEHTVAGLPLNGQPLYVQVSQRVGTLVESVTVEYTAPVRKGLAIITDFTDRRLEDWTGPGMTSVDDLSRQLREMEQHWAWLSRGLERFQWDIIRIQLPHPAVADAYPGWVSFRDDAITLARQQARTTDYDVDGDGVIDVAWLIVSSGYESVPFAIGGSSRNAGANLFVDGQASGSVQAGATGNFTHELGHCLGLPDMYGPYTTMNKLTVMADSWALPPADFSAYERLKLGWLELQTITRTTPGIRLPSANEELAAVLVPTIRPMEYFLIEYRDPPSSGYGSAVQGYRGLAVYHVLENSSMWQDPPIIRLEPADGANVPNQALDPEDFVYPENPAWLGPMTLRSYYNDRDDVFQIDNVVWRDGGLVFDVTIVPQPKVELLANGSFESGASNLPDSWRPDAYVPQDATFAWPGSPAFSGAASAYLESTSGNDIRWVQSVTTLVPGERYQVCGALKGEDVRGVQDGVGANISLMGGWVRSDGLSGTFDWTTVCVAFTAEAARADVACRLGFYGSTARGKLWCDDFTLERVLLHRAFQP